MTSSSSFTDISVEEYSEYSVVVRGETRKYKEDLKKLGGKYNSRLRDGPGWIFSKRAENNIKSFISKGTRLVSEEEAAEGERKSKEWEAKRERENKVKKTDLSLLIKHIISLESKIDNLTSMVGKLQDTTNDTIIVEDSDSDSEEDDEEIVPRKRLLK